MAHSNGLSEAPSGPYGNLLQALRANKGSDLPRKKRKLNGSHSKDAVVRQHVVEGKIPPADPKIDSEQGQQNVVDEQKEDHLAAEGSDDEDAQREDPFQQHFTSFDDAELARITTSRLSENSRSLVDIIDDEVRKTWAPVREGTKAPTIARQIQDLHIKRRLFERGKIVFQSLSSLERDFARAVCSYYDILAGFRTPRNGQALRDVCMLHCLNHVFKTRDRVLRNNAKLSQADGDEPTEARDQGFVRPKVLIIVPTKQSCVQLVESITKLCEPDQQENKSRFLDQFSRDDEAEWQEKPEDFRELFGGNHEEDFRIGLKFTRKTVKYFSGFYNSDIILASPLGMRRSIEGAGTEEEGKSEDSDFLSSIEIAVVDHASALQMQNWEHVEFLFSKLNLLPRESHGCDFSRVRHWYLDGHAKYLRQTVILSSYLTPEISSLAATHLHNIAGRLRYVPTYKGATVDVSSLLPMSIHQTFIRFDAATAVGEAEARFKLFISAILPQLLREGDGLQGVLIFVPAYSDFVRLRNHLSGTLENTTTSLGSISEYTPVKEVNRSRSHFISGRHNLLLYSERAHHHFRYRLLGVRKIIFYEVPENPIFWTEIISLLGSSGEGVDGDKKGRGLVRALFSRWDAMKLERVVGTERVSRLLSEKSGDTFDFV